MKKQIVIILSLVFTFNLSAYAIADTVAPEESVTFEKIKSIADLAAEVKKNLLERSCIEVLKNGSADIERTYQFQEIGRLEIITNYTNGKTESESKVWRISNTEYDIILTLTDLSSDESTDYRIVQTPNGLILTDDLLQKKLNWIFQ